ncbi:hypothetical protein [Chryseobacterium indoltheticum]|uniref:hypothetical protein n=1 Tax=Chryseobacterium indoltheticum TaxID=254 RepID=UPI003F498B80
MQRVLHYSNGQIEDYAVKILGALSTSETVNKSDVKIVYIKADNKLQLLGNKKFKIRELPNL